MLALRHRLVHLPFSELEGGVDGPELRVVSGLTNDVNDVGGGWGNGWDIEVEGWGGPDVTGAEVLSISLGLVVDEGTEEVALEADVVELSILEPGSSNVELLGGVEGWVGWVSVGGGWVEEEHVVAVGLGEHEGVVGDGSVGGDGLGEVGEHFCLCWFVINNYK